MLLQSSPYPKYQSSRFEQNEWFATPMYLGHTAEQVAIAALGLHTLLAPRTIEALIIDRQDALGEQPVLLGRLLKFDPGFNLVFDQAALAYLQREHGLWLGESI